MEFFDWHHDGEKTPADSAIEMMMSDDIEAEAEKEAKAKAGGLDESEFTKRAWEPVSSPSADDKNGSAVFNILKIIFGIAFAALCVDCVISIFTGYLTPAEVIVCAGGIVFLIVRKMRKKL